MKTMETDWVPRVAITMGDPTGIGPEIIVGALHDGEVYRFCHPIVIGRPDILERAIHLLGLDVEVVEVPVAALNSEVDFPLRGSPRSILCINEGGPEASAAMHGRVDPRGGQAAYDCLVLGANLALSHRVDAIVTAPLHKAALHAAGHHWPGHTELLAHLCGVEQFAMMLYLPPRLNGESEGATRPKSAILEQRGGPVGLGVVHVTLHMALREVFQHLTPSSILEKIALAESTFRKLRASLHLPQTPAIAVAALNPHGGESGLFGDEEIKIIAPAVELAQARGWNVKGPLPIDTLMPRAAQGEYDVVVAMYHDQGHIALKLLDMFDAVNITLGLPILRTSVAHGTAHDQAWKGTASSSGMIQAIRTAAQLAERSVSVEPVASNPVLNSMA